MTDENMNKQRVVLTGGSGLAAINWACAVRDHWDVILGTHLHSVELAGTTSCKLYLDNPAQLGLQLDQLSPDLVVHTAGLTNVDRCEGDPVKAHHANAEIARNVAHAVASRNIRLVHISTDHLFSGNRSFYRENDLPQPLNEYGRTKALAEAWVQAAYPNALIVRTNFFGWGHSQRQSFSDWLIYNLREGKVLTLFDDVYYTPILVDTLALATHELVEKGASGIFNMVGDERLSKYAFALLLVEQFGLSAELIQRDQILHAHLPAKRPLDMSLDNNKARQILGRRLGTVPQFLRTLHAQEIEGRRSELFAAIRSNV